MLWHREFWLVALAEMAISASVYAFVPVLPVWLSGMGRMDLMPFVCLAFAVGLYLCGGFIDSWIECYRRNHLCQLGIFLMALMQTGFYFFPSVSLPAVIVAVSFVFGACYGLTQMVLLSTLVIDKAESFQRTEANYIVSWFNRLALSVGPLAGALVYGQLHLPYVPLLAAGLSLLAIILLAVVPFPFKAPDESHCLFSTDRFFLLRGYPLYLNLLLFTFAMGLLLCHVLSFHYFASLMGGFFLAIMAEKYVFVNADLKSEGVAGSLLLMASALLRMTRPEHNAFMVSAIAAGIGIGILGSRYLLFFIKLSRHCERGTSQSTFFLSWETGLACGLACGYALGKDQWASMLALISALVGLAVYLYLVHPWYLKHKNR
jgi:predicted MFS family arabinose efflux permease